MMVARFVQGAVLTAGALAFSAGLAAAGHIGRTLPALEPAGLVFAVTSVDDMTPEMRKAYIRGIQEELAAHRYDPGPADGILGPMSRAAIQKYQRDAGLPRDGLASKELLDHLKFAEPKVYAKPDPKPDPLVLEVQTRLQELGYHRGALDGLMGATTRESIRAYRYDSGLPISGAIDGPLLDSLRPVATDSAGGTLLPEKAEAPEKAWSEPAADQELFSGTPPPAE
jgi:peptidoglycan hydrolase-like protein with peptidoglycan-binding domain